MRRLIVSFLIASPAISAFSQDNRIEHNGQQLFLNNTNLAWINFARDIGLILGLWSHDMLYFIE